MLPELRTQKSPEVIAMFAVQLFYNEILDTGGVIDAAGATNAEKS